MADAELRDTFAAPDAHRSESRQAAPADDRLREWERHGSHRWGRGVAVDLCDLESRVAALEKHHDAAPAARASDDRGRNDKADSRPGEGTGDTQEPVAWAVMSGGHRVYGIYDIEGEAVAICSWLRDEEDNGSWVAVPLYRSPTLTDAEREAISRIYDLLNERSRELQVARRIEESTPYVQLAKTLQTMWERLGGER